MTLNLISFFIVSQLAVKMNQMRLKGYVHYVSPAKKSRVKSFPYPFCDAEPIWLKVFTIILEKMLQKNSSDVTLQSPEEVVYTQLFLLENFTVHFKHQSLIVENIEFESIGFLEIGRGF